MTWYERLLEAPIKDYSRLMIPKDKLLELLDNVKSLFNNVAQLIEIDAENILVIGDTHGDVKTSINALSKKVRVKVFLGDYVDRGPYQIENINLLLLHLAAGHDIVLLRGNHESPLMNEIYGFEELVASVYGWDTYRFYAEVFSNMPYAALINNSILGLHGGLPENLEKLEDIKDLPKNDIIPSNPIAFEILWNDPDEGVKYFSPSLRGGGAKYFGEKPLQKFLKENNLSYMVRAHEPYPNGIQTFFNGSLITVFSCRYYPISEPKGLLIDKNNRWEPVSLL